MKTIVGSPLRQGNVTLVIPCMNEEGNLERLFDYINQTFQEMGKTLPVVLIDDGSTDRTPEILREMRQTYSFLTVIRHRKNRGVAEVWNTALAHVKTEWIMWGQADLESDPRTDIPTLLEAWQPGVDAIAGWRQGRGDGKLGASTLANKACRLAFGLKIHDMNWTKLVRRDLLAKLPVALITHRYLLAVLAGQGFNVTEVATPWHPRFSGESKFGRKRLFTSAQDFARVLGWFYVTYPVVSAINYAKAVVESAQVGFSAAKYTLQLKTESNTQEVITRNQVFRSDSSMVNIAYYRQLALSKLAA